jgi:hypothetical protein
MREHDCWDYRVMKRKRKGEKPGYGIYEVFYDETGKIEYWTEDPIGHECDSLKELKEDMDWQMSCTNERMLDYDECQRKARIRIKVRKQLTGSRLGIR